MLMMSNVSSCITKQKEACFVKLIIYYQYVIVKSCVRNLFVWISLSCPPLQKNIKAVRMLPSESLLWGSVASVDPELCRLMSFPPNWPCAVGKHSRLLCCCSLLSLFEQWRLFLKVSVAQPEENLFPQTCCSYAECVLQSWAWRSCYVPGVTSDSCSVSSPVFLLWHVWFKATENVL